MGPLRVWRGDTELDAGPRQQRCLLALLLARGGLPISTATLIELLWGLDAPASAVNVIHKYIGALRRLLEPERPSRSAGAYLLRHGSGYRFAADAETLDLMTFRRLVEQAKASQVRGADEEALAHYVSALRLCQGSAGEALSDSSSVATFAAIDSEFLDAAVAAAEIAVSLRRASEVLASLRLGTKMSRLNERVHAALITTLGATGHQAEALTVYRTIRGRLADELGIDPGHDLREAERQVLTQTVPPSDEGQGGLPAALDGPWPVPLIRPAQLPPDLQLFTGRAGELAELTSLAGSLRDDTRTSPLLVAMDGMGGVGKSTLAVHFAHLVADEFSDGQLYLDLRSDQSEDEAVTAGDGLRSLLYALGVPASNVPDTFDARTGTYRSLTAGKRILVLLDNVRDAGQVRPLLPNSAESLVIVTSRRPLVGLAVFDGAHLLRVDVPEPSAARELLERRLAGRLGRTTSGPSDSGVVEEIIELCGRLPLALAVLAARLIARPTLSLTTVVAELRDGAGRLGVFSGSRGVRDPRTAFSWSYRQLSGEAARLFRLMSAAPSPGLTAEACVSLAGREARSTQAALAELAEAALVSEDDDGRYVSHVLVKAYAEELLRETDTPAEREAAITRILQHYLLSSRNAQIQLQPQWMPSPPPPPMPGVVPEHPASYEQAFAWFASRRPVLREAVRLAADLKYGVVPWQLALTMQQYLHWSGYFQDWEDITRVALRAARQGHDVIGEAHSLRSLAGARYSVGAYDEAIGLLSAALPIYVNRGMVLEQGLVHSNLRSVHNAVGRDELALEHSERAAELFRLAGDSRTETIGLWGIGQALARLGELVRSTKVLERALELTLRVERLHVECEIRNDIAANLIAMGRTVEAAEQYRLAAATATATAPGTYHFKALSNLSELLIGDGNITGARDAFARARTVLLSLQDGGTDQMRAVLGSLEHKLLGYDDRETGNS